jgi:hypothetical protein
MDDNQVNFAITVTYFANYRYMIKPHVASSLWLQLINIIVHEIRFNVGISGNLILHYHLNFVLKVTLAYTNILAKQK